MTSDLKILERKVAQIVEPSAARFVSLASTGGGLPVATIRDSGGLKTQVINGNAALGLLAKKVGYKGKVPSVA